MTQHKLCVAVAVVALLASSGVTAKISTKSLATTMNTCTSKSGLSALAQMLAGSTTLTTQQSTLAAVAAQAFIYTYPLAATAEAYTHTAAEVFGTAVGSTNTYYASDVLVNASFTSIPTPNVDTLYSFMWLDLTNSPMQVTIPSSATAAGVYYCAMVMNAYGNTTSTLGTSSPSSMGQTYFITGPGYTSAVPSQFSATSIAVPTNGVFLLIRTQVNGTQAGLTQAETIQNAFTFTPYDSSAATPSAFWTAAVNASDIINTLSADSSSISSLETAAVSYFAAVSAMLTVNPPAAAEASYFSAFSAIGLSSDGSFDASSLSSDQKLAMMLGAGIGTNCIKNANTQDGQSTNGWGYNADVGSYPSTQTGYVTRAMVAKYYYAALPATQAIYMKANVDGDGNDLDGSTSNYTITFSVGQLPPATYFWSITAYNSTDNLLFDNVLNRYEIGSGTEDLVYTTSSTISGNGLTVYLSASQPTDATQAANWLPVGSTGFYLILRMYGPAATVASGKWLPPLIVDSSTSLVTVSSELF